MAGANELLAAIEAIHAAGLDETHWPQALASVTQLIGGVGTTMEIIDRRSLDHLEFFSFGVPPPSEIAYLSHYKSMNPRIPDALPRKAGEVIWDYRMLDEKGIDRSPFYGDFLAPMDMRYAIGGILKTTNSEFGAFVVQRSARHGHVDRAEIAIMERLAPHVSQSMDMTRRLRSERTASQSLECALDWLADGVALIGADGSIAYANGSFQAIARADDGLRIKKNALEFAFPAARGRFDAAIAGVRALRSGSLQAGGADFVVARPSGAAPYVVSVRPLMASRNDRSLSRPVAIVFIRNSPDRGMDDVSLLREVFGFTNAEASLALALRQGISLSEYAQTQGVSQNTVYTHARRIKEKTGCHRLPELIGKLNEVKTLLRRSQP
jgi:DNA-binding CsgD family transcriptional regulator/PAS domain-containing protein